MSARILLSAYWRKIMLWCRGTLNAIFTAQIGYGNFFMPTVLSCSTQICKVLVFLLQSDVDPHIETRGIRGLWGIYSFMYIIIYIINYNEYIVMYNIESHSLTITSTTWLNNVPHWYTNCKCTDKKALDEVNEALKVAYAQRALIPSLYTFF